MAEYDQLTRSASLDYGQLVPGHSTSRIAVHRSETTVKSCDVMVQSALRRDLAVSGTGTVRVINAIEHILKGMDENVRSLQEQ